MQCEGEEKFNQKYSDNVKFWLDIYIFVYVSDC